MRSFALLIVGNELRFLTEALELQDYLAGIGCRTKIVKTAYMKPETLERKLRNFVRASSDRPALVAYLGHGLREGWAPSGYPAFPYRRIVRALEGRRGPTLLFNDCCFAHAAASAMEEAGLDPRRWSLISASGSERTSFQGLVERVLDSWDAGRPYAPTRQPDERPPQALVFVDRTPLRIRLADLWSGWKRAVGNLFRRMKRPRVVTVRLAYCENDVRKKVMNGETLVSPAYDVDDRRWGAELDHHFFPEPD